MTFECIDDPTAGLLPVEGACEPIPGWNENTKAKMAWHGDYGAKGSLHLAQSIIHPPFQSLDTSSPNDSILKNMFPANCHVWSISWGGVTTAYSLYYRVCLLKWQRYYFWQIVPRERIIQKKCSANAFHEVEISSSESDKWKPLGLI